MLGAAAVPGTTHRFPSLLRPILRGAPVRSVIRAARPFSTSTYTALPPPTSRSPRSAPSQASPPRSPIGLTNTLIPFRTVQVAQPSTTPSSSDTTLSHGSSSLSPPTSLRSLLSNTDLSTHTVTLVSADPPIVRILSIKEDKDKARIAESKAKATRKTKIDDKEVQVSWRSGVGDLRHKASLARGIVEKGDRATVIFASKSGGGGGGGGSGSGSGTAGITSGLTRDEILAIFEQELQDVGTKWMDDEVKKGALVQFWQPVKKIRAERRQKVQDEEVTRRRGKDEKKEARKVREMERLKRAEEKFREKESQLAEGQQP